MGALILMSQIELERLKILEKVLERRLTQSDASKQMLLSLRQVKRLFKAFKLHGARGIVSKRRGRPAHNRYPEALKSHALDIVKEKYFDFGPTLVAEKLVENHNIKISSETARVWLIEAGIWKTRVQRAKRVHQPRYRRECFGELIQVDGSDHTWFEDRAPRCTLLVYVDDATSKLMELYFTKSESTFDYFYSTRRYLERHGKPIAFYSDKHTTFRVARTDAIGGTGMTQFGRAMRELNIDIICANTCQAKGRVERMNKTLQDRLVKELRLNNVSDMVTANKFLSGFIEKFNEKFAKEPLNPKNLHREFTPLDNFDDIFAWQEERTVSLNLTIQYDRVKYLINENNFTKTLKRKKIKVFDYPDGTVALKYEDEPLPYRTFDKIGHVTQAAIASNKSLSGALEWAKKYQEQNPLTRSQKAPKRRGQRLIMEAKYRKLNPAALAS